VNTALFTIYTAVSLRPLAVRPDQLLAVRGLNDPHARRNDPFSTIANTSTTTNRTRVSGLAPATRHARAAPRGDRDGFAPRPRDRQGVTENYFAVLAAAHAGALVSAEEIQAATPSVVVLSHRFWERY